MHAAGVGLWSATMAIGYAGNRGDGPRRRRRRGGARLPARGRRPRRATPRRRSKNAGTASRRRRLRLGSASRQRRARRTRRPRRTARSRSGPARTPWTNPGHDSESPASPTGLPVGDDAALCFAHHSQPHRRRKAKRQASRRSRQPPDPVDTVGQHSRIGRRATQPGPCPRRRAAPTARAARAKREA